MERTVVTVTDFPEIDDHLSDDERAIATAERA
jgi:hypothetical protein